MTANTLVLNRKIVIAAVVFCVAAMFVTSFVYRMKHPNLFVEVRQQTGPQQPVDHDHDGDGFQDDGPNAGMANADALSTPPPGMAQGMGGSMAMVKEFMAAVEKDPSDVKAQIELGKAFLMMRAWDRALEPLHKANELAPGDLDVLKAIGIAYFNKEDYTGASAAYDEILETAPNDTLALFNLGVIYKYYFEKKEDSIQYFEKVLTLEKNDEELIKIAKQELEELKN